MSSPLVSVVVRTKDRPHFLSRALSSIGAQTFTHWECVVVNDGGDPAPVEAAVARLPEDARVRVRVLHHSEPRGRWVSANAGVLASSAPLLVLHDDDDAWHPEFLQLATNYLEEHPGRAGVVSRVEIRWEQQRAGSFEVTDRELFQPQLAAPTLADTLLFNRFVPIAFVYRRSLHEEVGLYDQSLPVVADWSFNLRVLARGPLDYLADTPYAYWYQRVDVDGPDGNSVIASRGDHARFDARIRDDALREYVGEDGLGLVLYLTKFIDQRFVDIEAGLRQEIAESQPDRRARRRLENLPLWRRLRRGRS